MADPAPIRGRWTIHHPGYSGGIDQIAGPFIDGTVEVVPVPDEAAIERGAKALSQMRYGFMSSETLLNECRAEARAVLRAALEAPDDQ